MLYLTNAFSLNMLYEWRLSDPEAVTHVLIKPVADPAAFLTLVAEPVHGLTIKSIVGHKDVAALFAAALKRPVSVNRESVKLGENDILLVGQYIGPRLPAGTTELPVGAQLLWVCITIY